ASWRHPRNDGVVASQRAQPIDVAPGTRVGHLLRTQLVTVDGRMHLGAHLPGRYRRGRRAMTGMLADDTAPHTHQGAPLRVCHFVHAPAIGGVETAVAQLQRATVPGSGTPSPRSRLHAAPKTR